MALTQQQPIPDGVDVQTDDDKEMELYSVFQPHLIVMPSKEAYIFRTYIGAERDTSVKPKNICMRITKTGSNLS